MLGLALEQVSQNRVAFGLVLLQSAQDLVFEGFGQRVLAVARAPFAHGSDHAAAMVRLQCGAGAGSVGS